MLLRAYAWIDAHERATIVGLTSVAIVLRALLVIEAPTPQGYVWDFYRDGVTVLATEGRLPLAADCWQCYHPPLFYVVGLPFQEAGRWLGGTATADRLLAGSSFIWTAIVGWYGFRLLTFFGCRGIVRVGGVARPRC